MHLYPTGLKFCKNPILSLYTVRKVAGILAALTLLEICLVHCTRNSLSTPRYSITQVLKDYSTQVFKYYLSQIVTYHGEIAHVTYHRWLLITVKLLKNKLIVLKMLLRYCGKLIRYCAKVKID